MRPSTIRIDVTKIDKRHLYEGKNGAKYLSLALFENRDGEDQYGNTHFVTQELPKEARDAGERGAILGNAKIQKPGQQPHRGQPDRNFRRPDDDDRPSRTSGSTYRAKNAYVPPADDSDSEVDF